MAEIVVFNSLTAPDGTITTWVLSLLSVVMVLALHLLLHRRFRRDYLKIWATAWLLYGLWLALKLIIPEPGPNSVALVMGDWCLAVSALLLAAGAFVMMDRPIPRVTAVAAVALLLFWIYLSSQLVESRTFAQLPTALAIGAGNLLAGIELYRQERKQPFPGAALLASAYFFWGVMLILLPFVASGPDSHPAAVASLFVAQLFLGFSTLMFALDELRQDASDEGSADVARIDPERADLQGRLTSLEHQNKSLQRAATRLPQSTVAPAQHVSELAMQAATLRTLADMAAGISQQIGTAAARVATASETLLETNAGCSPETRRQLQEIQGAAAQVGKVIAQLHEFQRPRSDEESLEPIPVREMIAEIAEMAERLWREHPRSNDAALKIDTNIPDALPPVAGNASELRAAFAQLLRNAMDALPNGGSITLSASLAETAEQRALTIEVSDTGTGMDNHARIHCLEPFYSTRKGACGLGLSVVYGILQRHGGSVEIASTPGQGTKVRLIFPAGAPVPVRGPATDGKGPLRILFIDDDIALTQLLKEALELENHTVQTTHSGEAGCESFTAARRFGMSFDVVITDFRLPLMDGHQVAAHVKSESPATPVVMLTGWGDAIRASAFDAVLHKPLRLNELFHTLEKVRVAPTASSPLALNSAA